MSGIILLSFIIHIVFARDLCYSVNNVCETDVHNSQSIHYSGYDFVGNTHPLVHPDTPIYDDVKHFLKENICNEGTLITGLSKNQSINIFGNRRDEHTYYGKEGSIMAATQGQFIYLQERVMIHQPIKAIPFQLNYGSTRIFPDLELVSVWWGHFYSLLKSHSNIQLVPISVPEPSTIKGQTQYTLSCPSGTVLVIADPRCTFKTQFEIDPAEMDYDDVVVGQHTNIFGGTPFPQVCIRRIPMLFTGSVQVTTYNQIHTLAQVCTPSTYICATGPPIVRQIHIIKSSIPIHAHTTKESTYINSDQIPFQCTCSENDVAQKLINKDNHCSYDVVAGTVQLDRVVQSERHTLRQLCKADIVCDNDALEPHSIRECGCPKTSKNLIPQYNDDHAILRDPSGFSMTTPCKSWIPHQVKDTSILIPPFKRVRACDENLPSFRRRKRAFNVDFCAPIIVTVCFNDKKNNSEGGVTKAVLQNITNSIEISIRSLAEKSKQIQNQLNSANHVFNAYNLRINKIERDIKDIINHLNSFIATTNHNFDITHMEIEALRVKTEINKINFNHLIQFLKALHADRLSKMKLGFILNNNTGCVSLPQSPQLHFFPTMPGGDINHTLPPLPTLRTQTFFLLWHRTSI